MHAASEASTGGKKGGCSRRNSLPDNDQQRMPRASSLQALSADAEEVGEGEQGEDEGEEMASPSSEGLHALFGEEDDELPCPG